MSQKFHEEVSNICNNYENFINNIVFSDDSTVCLDDEINKYNCRYWSSENPHWVSEYHAQDYQKVNVWGGLTMPAQICHIIDPFFIDD